MYYVICETTVMTLEEAVDVAAFIEEKINKHGYSLEDFKVVHGIEVNLKTVETAIKILITN